MKVEINSKNGTKVVDLNRRKAIREKCLNCAGWSRLEVMNCTFKRCPFYNWRTGVGKQDPTKRKTAIQEFCLWCCLDSNFEIIKCTCYKSCALWSFRKSRVDRGLEL